MVLLTIYSNWQRSWRSTVHLPKSWDNAGIETNTLDDERRKKVNNVKDRIRNDCEVEAANVIEQNKAVIFALADKLIKADGMTIGQEEFAEFMASAHLIGPPQNPPEIDHPNSPDQLQLFYAIAQPPTDVTTATGQRHGTAANKRRPERWHSIWCRRNRKGTANEQPAD